MGHLRAGPEGLFSMSQLVPSSWLLKELTDRHDLIFFVILSLGNNLTNSEMDIPGYSF